MIHRAVRQVSNIKTSTHYSSSFSAPAKNSPSNERSVLGAQFNDSPPLAEADDSTRRNTADRVLTTGVRNLSRLPFLASGPAQILRKNGSSEQCANRMKDV